MKSGPAWAIIIDHAGVAKLADAPHSKCGGAIHAGSSPATGTTSEQALYRLLRLFCCCIYTAAISIETRRFPLKAPGLLSAPKLASPPILRAGGSLCLASVPSKVRSRRTYRTARMQSLCRFASWCTATSVKPTSVRKTESCALSKIRRPSMVESHFSSLGLIPSDSFVIRNVPPGFKTR